MTPPKRLACIIEGIAAGTLTREDAAHQLREWMECIGSVSVLEITPHDEMRHYAGEPSRLEAQRESRAMAALASGLMQYVEKTSSAEPLGIATSWRIFILKLKA